MYGFVWRHLPGPLGVRLALGLVLVVGVLALLWFLAFPWIDARYSYSPGTVN